MKEKPRFKFIDYLRGWALLVMIEVHVFNSMLIPSIRGEKWFFVLTFINGLVAPSFLFISGFAFGISSNSKLEELRSFGKAFWKKTWRILMILLIGYALHFPFRSVFVLRHNFSWINWEPFYNVDILQCISVGLMILFAARLLFKSDKLYDLFVLIAALLFIFLSPVVWQIDFSKYMHSFFTGYFNNKNGSLFPLFPWLGFMFLGTVACKYFMDARKKDKEKKYFHFIAISALILFLIRYYFPADLLIKNFWDINPNPLFFILRLSYILLFLVICWYYEIIRKPEKSFVTDVGKESLLVYWLHLFIIYGVFWGGKSLYSIVNQRFDILESSLMTLAIMLLMIFTAKLWSMIKLKWKKSKSIIKKEEV